MRYDLYVDSYRRYKLGTNSIAKWLLVNGRACGATLHAEPKPGKRYLMPLSQFVHLAEAIADSGVLVVTQYTISTIKEVIGLRRAASSFYQQQASSKDLMRSNEGHIHTIRVLEEVLDLLEPLPRAEDADKSANPIGSENTAPTSTTNIFDVLTVEEIGDSEPSLEIGRRARASTRKSRSATAEPVVETATEPQEIFFVRYCFFRDLQDVRSQLQETWKMYRNGEIPLLSASVTTDLAFDVVRRREAEMLDLELTVAGGKVQTLKEVAAQLYGTHTRSTTNLFWRLKDNAQFNHGYLGDLLFGHLAETGNIEIAEDGKMDEAIEEPTYNVAEMLCIPAFILLDNLDAMGPGTPLNGDVHLQSAAETWAVVTPALEARARFREDKDLLGELFHQMRMLYFKGWHGQLPHDVWTKAMFEDIVPLQRTPLKQRLRPLKGRQGRNLLPVWLVWATSIQLDINRLLDNRRDHPFNDLVESGRDLQSAAKKHLAWSKKARPQGWDLRADGLWVPTINVVLSYLDKDPVADFERARYPDIPPSKPHMLFRLDPTWSGVICLWFKLSLWGIGIEIATLDLHSSSPCIYTTLPSPMRRSGA